MSSVIAVTIKGVAQNGYISNRKKSANHPQTLDKYGSVLNSTLKEQETIVETPTARHVLCDDSSPVQIHVWQSVLYAVQISYGVSASTICITITVVN